MKYWIAAWLLLPALALADQGMRLPPETGRLNRMAARFAPVDIRVELSAMPANERQALASLIRAARLTDALFMRQMWAGNEALLLRLLEDTTPLGRAQFEYFLINRGPWSRLDENAVFIPGAPEKPEAGNFYPAGRRKRMSKAGSRALKARSKAPRPVFSPRSAATRPGSSSPCPTASSTKASSRRWRGTCALRRPQRPSRH